MKKFFLGAFLMLLWSGSILQASPAVNAATDLKGFFGESLADDIYQAAGRKIIPYKVNPNLHGPDRIYKLPNGYYEVHEVKAYTSWAGKQAMKTTSRGIPTHELSRRWCNDWVNKTLSNSVATNAEKKVARDLAAAIKNKKVKFIFDEFNLNTQQFRASEVVQIGKDNVRLIEKLGPSNLKRFDQFFSKKSKDFLKIKLGKLDGTLTRPSVHQTWQPLSSKDKVKLLPEKAYRKAGVKRIEIRNALMTSEGKLLVPVKYGAKTALLVFVADAGYAIYEYTNGDILKPELEQKIADAAIKGTFVGTCVGATIFLGATPAGWCVLAVSVGSYFIVDQTLKIWHRHQKSKYLTMDDMKSWGIVENTVLSPDINSPLSPEENTVLNPSTNSILLF